MTRLLLRVYFGDSWIGPGKVQLLAAIRTHGSISAAARSMEMSYRRAWLLVDSLNTLFRKPVVRTELGGRGGGTASLTPLGALVIDRYRAMEVASKQAITRDAAALQRYVATPAPAGAASGRNATSRRGAISRRI